MCIYLGGELCPASPTLTHLARWVWKPVLGSRCSTHAHWEATQPWHICSLSHYNGTFFIWAEGYTRHTSAVPPAMPVHRETSEHCTHCPSVCGHVQAALLTASSHHAPFARHWSMQPVKVLHIPMCVNSQWPCLILCGCGFHSGCMWRMRATSRACNRYRLCVRLCAKTTWAPATYLIIFYTAMWIHPPTDTYLGINIFSTPTWVDGS